MALALSGLPTDRFFFGGFLPAKEGERRRAIAAAADVPATLVFFEAPHRLADSLVDLADLLGAAAGRRRARTHQAVRGGASRSAHRACRALCPPSRREGRDRHRDRPAGRGGGACRPSGSTRRCARRWPAPRSRMRRRKWRRAMASSAATSMPARSSSSARPVVKPPRDDRGPPGRPSPGPCRRMARGVAPAARRLFDPGAALQDQARRDRHRGAARRHPGLRRGQGAGRHADRHRFAGRPAVRPRGARRQPVPGAPSALCRPFGALRCGAGRGLWPRHLPDVWRPPE